MKVWAGEMYDMLIKEDNAGKLPEFVVSSQELQRVPLTLMSGANDVLPVCTRMNMLEKKVEEMVDNMANFTKGQLLLNKLQVPVPNDVSYANALQGANGGGLDGVHPLGTPVRPRVGSFADAAVIVQKRKQRELASVATPVRQPGQVVQPQTEGPHGGQGAKQVVVPKVPKKQCFGASKIKATGRADWAAPVEVFVSNTSPDITGDDVKVILKLCADDIKASEGNEFLADFTVKAAKCLTKPEIENPRTKCWKVSVPFRYKEYIMSDLAYPIGWSHRPWYPPKFKSKEEHESEQQAKRARQNNM